MEKKLESFGNLFVRSVRDNTLFVLEGIISGHMKSAIDKEMNKQISKMSKENIEVLRDVAYRMVDLSLHNLLVMFEENPEWKVSNESEDVQSISELSDGLAGELYTSDGWIVQYSSYPLSKGL